MNTGDKILGKHIRQFLHKNNVKLGSLTISSYSVVVQKQRQRKTKSVLHVQIYFFAT